MTNIVWDWGTAYDFFISLFVLHNPDRFGLRGQWAAGVRSRLSQAQRDFLEDAVDFVPLPISWILSLNLEKKDVRTILDLLNAIPAEERLLTLLRKNGISVEVEETIKAIQQHQAFTNSDLEILRDIYRRRMNPVKQKTLQKMAEACMQPEEFGKSYLQALRSYHQVFFAEEEARITPVLQTELKKAQELSTQLALPKLLEELSHGISYQEADTLQQVNLVPSFWTSPLVFINRLAEGNIMMVFGARPDSQNLVPGEYVPEALNTSLKALSDATRLRILRYLNEAPDSPSGLARKLRLRAPTVVHHLSVLRLAGLVYVIISQEGERRYALRKEALHSVMDHLTEFLETSETG